MHANDKRNTMIIERGAIETEDENELMLDEIADWMKNPVYEGPYHDRIIQMVWMVECFKNIHYPMGGDS